jgi:ubiquinol-cytochrome c reductase cytochrome b subunit
MKKLIDWIDQRTGLQGLLHEVLFERIPGGARWRYVWGSTLSLCFFVQIVTGVVLWMAYSPSAHSAWESVYYIQHEMTGGWFLRGLHHFVAQAMHVLLVLHLLQVIIDGAYKAPREVNYWFGIVLLMLTLGLGLTGYLLPWDQKGFGATKVATSLMGIVPVIGPSLQKLVVGGSDYGHHTLTRFFALHAGVLPGLMIAAIAAHVALFRRHGITAKQPYRKPEARFWPDQVLMDGVACLAVLATVVYLTVRHHGAELHAPADPTQPFNAARPEWYFLFLFEFLKLDFLTQWFGHHGELVGAIIIPGLVMGVLAAMPLLGNWRLGHRFNLGFLGAILVGAVLLTVQSLRSDAGNPGFQAAVAQAHAEADRMVTLIRAAGGIPRDGAASLLKQDPATVGPRLFAQHCASCHRYGGHDGLGVVSAEAPSAPDLRGFGSAGWLRGLLQADTITNSAYYGGTKFRTGKMVRYVREKLPKLQASEPGALESMIAAVVAEADLPADRAGAGDRAGTVEAGRRHVATTFGCTDCHAFRKPDEEATAPTLTGWASRDWMVRLVGDPTHADFYGARNDRMPSYLKEGRLSERDIGLIVDWIRGDTDPARWLQAPVATKPSSSGVAGARP